MHNQPTQNDLEPVTSDEPPETDDHESDEAGESGGSPHPTGEPQARKNAEVDPPA